MLEEMCGKCWKKCVVNAGRNVCGKCSKKCMWQMLEEMCV